VFAALILMTDVARRQGIELPFQLCKRIERMSAA
jgi:hypothetical protein